MKAAEDEKNLKRQKIKIYSLSFAIVKCSSVSYIHNKIWMWTLNWIKRWNVILIQHKHINLTCMQEQDGDDTQKENRREKTV